MGKFMFGVTVASPHNTFVHLFDKIESEWANLWILQDVTLVSLVCSNWLLGNKKNTLAEDSNISNRSR